MVTVGKIGGSGGGEFRSPGYYTEQVARGAEDYYSGHGEAPGQWAGRGAGRLGLSGQISEGEVEALFERRDPDSGELLGRVPGAGSVRGFDVQMAVPKSVSTLWALAEEHGRPEVAGKVWEAAHGAASATLGYLERHACTSRAGAGGKVPLRGEGFVAAVFPHRFSREGDPQIHVHVLVANLTRCGRAEGVGDGWRTLDARDLYEHKLTAGYLFQAELRERLTRELGVEWGPVEKGAAEVVGVPAGLTRALSRRRSQILDALDRDGRGGSAREAEIAALATRRAKETFDLDAERARWRALAQEHGFDRDSFDAALDRTEFRPRDLDQLAAPAGDLVGADGLTRERSTFARRDVVRELAARQGGGGSIPEIEAAASRVIASDRVVAIPAAAAPGRRPEPVLSTPEMVEIETRMVDQATARVDSGAGKVELADGTRFERRPGGLVLSDEQQALARQLVTSGNGVEVVRAKAGTGKTTAIDAARELWEQAGHRVIGAALAGRAADELRARAGIDSYTVHGLLQDLDRRVWKFPARTVLVVDEAGMVDTRRLARLLDHATHADAKVVLVGDERQLPAIEAGGAFKGLADRLGAIELAEVHRQDQGWDREALDQLRHGDIADWIAAYDHHGRLVRCDSPDHQARTLVADWWVAARQDGMDETLMLAGRRHEVADLNHLARATRIAAGDLDDTRPLVLDGRRFAVGDRVIALRNRHVPHVEEGRHLLRNGNRATVVAVDHGRGELTVGLDSGPAVRIPADYLAAGHVDHGYAMTIHKAQGMTCRQTFVLASPDLARELGYVAASRHTDQARFYVNAPDHHQTTDRDAPAPADGTLWDDLQRTLGIERAKHLAIDHTETDADLANLPTADLVAIQDRGRRLLRAVPSQDRRALDAERVRETVEVIARQEQHLAETRDQLDATSRLRRQTRAGLQERVRYIERAVARQREVLAERVEAADSFDLDAWLDQNDQHIAEAAAADRELASRRDQAHHDAHHHLGLDTQPEIHERIGPRPDNPADRDAWDQAAATLDTYHRHYGQHPDQHTTPADPLSQQHTDLRHALHLADKTLNPPSRDRDYDYDMGW
ncbi:MAG: relaxase domain-containing protein [Solirubrobacterales bacterium]|nr:relaxase domain-containing protein [Solirubrobacterales bacterium]